MNKTKKNDIKKEDKGWLRIAKKRHASFSRKKALSHSKIWKKMAF